MRIKLIKGEEGGVKALELWQEAWKRNRSTRKLWFERIEAESQFRLHAQRKTHPTKFINEYAEYLFGSEK